MTNIEDRLDAIAEGIAQIGEDIADEDTSVTLKDINKRLDEITDEIEQLGDDITAEALGAFEAEVDTLKEERKKIVSNAQQRKNLLKNIASDRTPVTVKRSFFAPGGSRDERSDRHTMLSSMAYRRAFMDHVLRGAPIPAEYRADQNTKVSDVGPAIPTTILDRIISNV